MRILANYGYKANGDMYSVTFETMGDVPSTQAPQAVDELFRLAKEAVQRQLTAAGAKVVAQPATTVTIPQPKGNGQPATAAPNGRKPQIKDPSLPANQPVSRSQIRELFLHGSGVREIDGTPLIILIFCLFIALRFIARGFSDYQAYAMFGALGAVGLFIRYLIFRQYFRRRVT